MVVVVFAVSLGATEFIEKKWASHEEQFAEDVAGRLHMWSVQCDALECCWRMRVLISS